MIRQGECEFCRIPSPGEPCQTCSALEKAAARALLDWKARQVGHVAETANALVPLAVQDVSKERAQLRGAGFELIELSSPFAFEAVLSALRRVVRRCYDDHALNADLVVWRQVPLSELEQQPAAGLRAHS